jgi:transcriptional regulator of nitric oxide reductase
VPKLTRVRNPKLQRFFVHGLRVALFVAVLWMIRDASKQTTADDIDFTANPEVAEFVDQSIPGAIFGCKRLGDNLIYNASDNTIGSVIQTSPQSDHIIGYSGPTNCWIVLDEQSKIVSIEVANSGDTIDHVAAVKNDPTFAESFRGIGFGETDQWQDIDAVSGATLTSYAIVSSVANRMGASAPSLKFMAQPHPHNVSALFDSVARVSRIEATDRPNIWNVYCDSDLAGFVMATTPFADQISGYQGPTMTLAGFDAEGKCVGLIVDQTYENQPYANYLDDDRYFQKLYVGKTLQEIAQLTPEENGIDGVSGATMTSMSVAESLPLAAKGALQPIDNAAKNIARRPISWWADIVTVLLTIAGVMFSFGRFGKFKKLRFAYLLAVIVFLGFINGHMISQASIVGWSTSAIPWSVAPGLVFLSLAALAIPMFTKHQPYCHHICPFGAMQQLTRKRIGWKVSIPKAIDRALKWIPFALLLLVVLAALSKSNFNLASIEPFDGFAFRVAGWATIGVFAIGLIASIFSPMAYCRYGCPTGALLGFLKFRADSHRLGPRDWAAMLLVAAAFLLQVA